MGIVLITIPGKAREWLASEIGRETSALELVIVQRPRPKPPVTERISKLWKEKKWQMWKEAWYAVLLRLHPEARNTLSYFTHSSMDTFDGVPGTKVIEVDSVNSSEVHEVLNSLSPDLLIVWGNTILEPRIVQTSKRAINLHFGLCPYYRGALANQYAVMCDDLSHVGATIHYINGKLDSGDILATVVADTSKSPSDMFRDTNDRAIKRFVEVVSILYKEKELPARSQERMGGKNFLLKSWTPSTRYQLGTKLIEWEKSSQH